MIDEGEVTSWGCQIFMSTNVTVILTMKKPDSTKKAKYKIDTQHL